MYLNADRPRLVLLIVDLFTQMQKSCFGCFDFGKKRIAEKRSSIPQAAVH